MRSIAWALLALFIMSPMAMAGEHEEAEDAERAAEGEDGAEWEYQIMVSADRASIEMSRESGENENSVEFEYKRDEAAVEFSYEEEAGEVESEAQMEVQFHQIFEYEDENGNGQYDVGEEIVSVYQLSDDSEEELLDADYVTWSAITQSSVTSDNGVSGTKFTSTADIGGGELRFDFYVFGDEASLGAADVQATEIKLDIIIENYPFQSNTSAIGLFLESESEAEIEDDRDVDSDEEGVVANAGTAQMLFAWKDFATVDGADMAVKTTTLEVESSQEPGEFEHEELFVMSYPRGEVIVHDPTMGVHSGSSKGVPGPAIGLVIAGVALVALLRRK